MGEQHTECCLEVASSQFLLSGDFPEAINCYSS